MNSGVVFLSQKTIRVGDVCDLLTSERNMEPAEVLTIYDDETMDAAWILDNKLSCRVDRNPLACIVQRYDESEVEELLGVNPLRVVMGKDQESTPGSMSAQELKELHEKYERYTDAEQKAKKRRRMFVEE